MAYKSKLLNSQITEIFGGQGVNGLNAAISSIHDHESQKRLHRLLHLMDNSSEAYVGLQYAKAKISSEVYSDWDLVSAKINSGHQWQRLLGYLPQELDSQIETWQRLVAPEDLRQLQTAMASHVMRRSNCFETECRLRRKDGKWQWLLVRGVITSRMNDGRPARMLVMQKDISTIKSMEDQVAELKKGQDEATLVRSRFIAKISHELRTPMNGIMGMAELLSDTILDDEQRHYLAGLKTSSSTLLNTISDLLEYTQTDTESTPSKIVDFDPSRLIFESAKSLAFAAHAKSLELIIDISPDIPKLISSNPDTLRRIILNLVDNAVKFTPAGEIIITASSSKLATTRHKIDVAVTDTGIGVAKERQKQIFDAFDQADNSSTRSAGGTGLGLAISERLASSLGGSIQLSSDGQHGSTFCFTAEFNTPILQPQPCEQASQSMTRLVLLEPNPRMVTAIERIVTSLGMSVDHFLKLEKFGEKIGNASTSDRPFEVILVDARTVLDNQNSLVPILKSNFKPDAVVIMLKPDGESSQIETLRKLGFSSFLNKPFSSDDLKRIVNIIDQGSRGSDDLVLAPLALPESLPAQTEGSLSILLVDDNPMSQELIKRVLEKSQHRVTLASNGIEALGLFDNHNFDIILMDVSMPMMGGIETTEAIRMREMRRSWVISQNYTNAYIIAITANALPGDRERCLEAGMDDYLSKPVDAHELHAALARSRLRSNTPFGDYQNAETSIVNFKVAEEQLGDRDLLKSMAKMFHGEWKSHIEKIEEAIEIRAIDVLTRHVKNSQALLSMFHAREAANAAARIIRQQEQKNNINWEEIKNNFNAFTMEMKKIEPEFSKFLRHN